MIDLLVIQKQKNHHTYETRNISDNNNSTKNASIENLDEQLGLSNQNYEIKNAYKRQHSTAPVAGMHHTSKQPVFDQDAITDPPYENLFRSLCFEEFDRSKVMLVLDTVKLYSAAEYIKYIYDVDDVGDIRPQTESLWKLASFVLETKILPEPAICLGDDGVFSAEWRIKNYAILFALFMSNGDVEFAAVIEKPGQKRWSSRGIESPSSMLSNIKPFIEEINDKQKHHPYVGE